MFKQSYQQSAATIVRLQKLNKQQQSKSKTK